MKLDGTVILPTNSKSYLLIPPHVRYYIESSIQKRIVSLELSLKDWERRDIFKLGDSFVVVLDKKEGEPFVLLGKFPNFAEQHCYNEMHIAATSYLELSNSNIKSLKKEVLSLRLDSATRYILDQLL